VFGLCHLLGYRFAPRIQDLKDRKLYTVEKPGTWPLLTPSIGDTVETAAILGQWTELMRLKDILNRFHSATVSGSTCPRAYRSDLDRAFRRPRCCGRKNG
jgi:TnpA family transposase